MASGKAFRVGFWALLRQVFGVILFTEMCSQINTYSMKQPDLYYFETIKMTSQPSQILYRE